MTFGKIGCTKLLTNMLPYDMEVEYLEVTKTQQIDTQVVPTVLDTYSIDFMSTATSPHCGIWSSVYGTWDAVPNKWLFLKLRHATGPQASTWNFKPSGTQYTEVTSSTNLVNDRRSYVVLSLKDKFCSFSNSALSNTVELSVGTPAIEQPSILLRNGAWSGKIYGWTVERDEIIIQQCVPVRFTNELGQTEGAMYDRISKQFFRNQGTGSFIIGPDKT